MKKKSTLSWVLEFAGRKKICFGGSVLLAILGVAASFIPYLLTANVVGQLIAGNRDWSYYLQMMLIMALCWVIRIQGKWGNGDERKQKLTDAGYDYGKVQTRVNELMKNK